jgi:hypothetical protein
MTETKKLEEPTPAQRAEQTKEAFKRNFLALLWTDMAFQSQVVFKGELRLRDAYRRPQVLPRDLPIPFFPPADQRNPVPRDSQVRTVLRKLLLNLFDAHGEIRNIVVLRTELRDISFLRVESVHLARYITAIPELSQREEGMLESAATQVKELLLTDPEIREILVLEGELRPEAFRYPRFPVVNGGKGKR